MTQLDPRAIEVASKTDVGRQRSNNQDHFGEGFSPSGARLLIVADGMGGHAGGATASRVAVDTVQQVVASSSESDLPETTLRAALERANQAVHEQAQRDSALAGMGTTGVALLFTPDAQAWVANVGDSRAYRLRGDVIEQITEDHSLVAELQRRGILSAEEALVHPRRNEVLRSLGVEPEVMVDVKPVDLRPGDCFLLCSDGLSGVVRDEEIADILRRETPEEAARQLVDFANERGGPDNVTVQVARIPELRVEEAGSERERQIRSLSLAVVVVALLLAAVLLWVLVAELRGPGSGAAGPIAPATGEAPAPDE